MRRNDPGRHVPPPLELECLKVLWELGEANVRAVREGLAPRRALAYTTILTVLDRLANKGIIARRKVGRAFVYSAVATREELRKRAVRDLLESFFSGSEKELVAYLLHREPYPNGLPAAPESSLDPALL